MNNIASTVSFQKSARSLASCILIAATAILAVQPARADWGDGVANCGVQIVSTLVPSLCLSYADTVDRSSALLRPCSGTINQSWNVRLADDGGIFLESAQAAERVLEVADGSTTSGGRVQFWGLNVPWLRRTQQWNIVPARLRATTFQDFAVNILNENSRFCLDIQWGNAVEGTPVWQWPCNGGDAQTWRLIVTNPDCSGVSHVLP